MAVPTRGRGLSRAVFQAPDLIGQAQRQQQIDQRDRALELQEQQFKAKQAAASKVDPFKLDNGDIASFPTLYSDLGSSYNNMIYDFVQNNAMALARQKEVGFGKELNQLNRMLSRGKKLSTVLSNYENSFSSAATKTSTDREAYKQFPQVLSELTGNVSFKPSENGFEVVDAQGNPIPMESYLVELNPSLYYQRQPSYYDDFLRFGTESLNRENLNVRANMAVAEKSRDKNIWPLMVAEYWRGRGFDDGEIPVNLANDLIENKKVEIEGEVITVQDVKDYNRKNYIKNNSQIQPQEEDGNISISDYVRDANLAPFTEEELKVVQKNTDMYGPFVEPVDLQGVSIPRNRQARIEVPLEVKRGDEKVMEDFQGQITSVYKNANGGYTGLIYVPEKNVYRSVDLNDNDLGRVRQEMRLPTNITLDQVIQTINQGNQSQPKEQPSQQEENWTEEDPL